MSFQLKRVLISDEVDDKCLQILKENGIDATKKTKLSKEELIAELQDYDGLIVRSATKVTADVIEGAKNLKIIGRAGTGVDNIDCNAATKCGVIVMNTPDGNTLSAAEHTCALLLAMSRNISRGTSSMCAGRWDRKSLMGNEVHGKTLAIIGLGKIGKEVAKRMQAFGMKTVGFDPLVSAEEAAMCDIEWKSLEELWPVADYITLHVPLIAPTKHMINEAVLLKCKKGVKFINCARGGIIKEDDLLFALESGQCSGAALDVFEQEPPTDQRLVQHPLVTSTPHLGASTIEAQNRVAVDIAKQFVDYSKGRSLFGAINAQALSNALSPETKPWVDLGRGLGAIGATLLDGVINGVKVNITTQGGSLKTAGSYLGAAISVGMLQHCSQGINLVSAPALAKDNLVQLTTEHQDQTPEGVQQQLTVCFEKPDGAVYSLTGHVTDGAALLTSIGDLGFRPSVTLKGNLLFFKSSATKPLLGALEAALTDKNVFIQGYCRSFHDDGDVVWNVLHTLTPCSTTDVPTSVLLPDNKVYGVIL